MTVQKIDALSDLKRIARGKKPIAPIRVVADWAVKWAELGLAQSDIAQLERLHRLEDPRGE